MSRSAVQNIHTVSFPDLKVSSADEGKYRQVGRSKAQALVDVSESNPLLQWYYFEDKKSITMSKAHIIEQRGTGDSGSSLVMRGTVQVGAHISEVVDLLACTSTDTFKRNMRGIHDDFLEGQCLKVIDEGSPESPFDTLTLKWAAFQANAPNNMGKDFVYLECCTPVRDIKGKPLIAIVYESVNRPEIGPLSYYQLRRTEYHRTGFVLRESLRRDVTVVTFICEMPVSGSLLSLSSMEAEMKQRVMCLAKLHPLMERRRLTECKFAEKWQWVPDEQRRACKVCVKMFNYLRAKHHCRVCGDVVCAKCAPNRDVDIPDVGSVRVCNICMLQLRSTTQREPKSVRFQLRRQSSGASTSFTEVTPGRRASTASDSTTSVSSRESNSSIGNAQSDFPDGNNSALHSHPLRSQKSSLYDQQQRSAVVNGNRRRHLNLSHPSGHEQAPMRSRPGEQRPDYYNLLSSSLLMGSGPSSSNGVKAVHTPTDPQLYKSHSAPVDGGPVSTTMNGITPYHQHVPPLHQSHSLGPPNNSNARHPGLIGQTSSPAPPQPGMSALEAVLRRVSMNQEAAEQATAAAARAANAAGVPVRMFQQTTNSSTSQQSMTEVGVRGIDPGVEKFQQQTAKIAATARMYRAGFGIVPEERLSSLSQDSNFSENDSSTGRRTATTVSDYSVNGFGDEYERTIPSVSSSFVGNGPKSLEVQSVDPMKALSNTADPAVQALLAEMERLKQHAQKLEAQLQSTADEPQPPPRKFDEDRRAWVERQVNSWYGRNGIPADDPTIVQHQVLHRHLVNELHELMGLPRLGGRDDEETEGMVLEMEEEVDTYRGYSNQDLDLRSTDEGSNYQHSILMRNTDELQMYYDRSTLQSLDEESVGHEQEKGESTEDISNQAETQEMPPDISIISEITLQKTVPAALNIMRDDESPTNAIKALVALVRILRNIESDPTSSRFLSVSTSDAFFRQYLSNISGATQLFRAAGFTIYDDRLALHYPDVGHIREMVKRIEAEIVDIKREEEDQMI